MIARLAGTLVERTGTTVVVDVAGVGYSVVMPAPDAASVGTLGDEVVVATHLYVREDAQVLYGFCSPATRQCFTELVGTRGVGPTLALSMLAHFSPAALAAAVAAGDAAALAKVPGIGPKSAARLVTDLTGRISALPSSAPTTPGAHTASSAYTEAHLGLCQLGYSPEEASTTLDKLTADGTATDDAAALLRSALRALAGGR